MIAIDVPGEEISNILTNTCILLKMTIRIEIWMECEGTSYSLIEEVS